MSEQDEHRPHVVGIEHVIASYGRCRDKPSFFRAFYKALIERDERIAAHFASTDMERQATALRSAINELLMYAQGSQVAIMAADRLAKSHSRTQRNVEPELYPVWIDCLVHTVARYDPRYESGLGDLWRSALAPGIARMVAGYER